MAIKVFFVFLSGRCTRSDTAMTGEITLRGLVLPVRLVMRFLLPLCLQIALIENGENWGGNFKDKASPLNVFFFRSVESKKKYWQLIELVWKGWYCQGGTKRWERGLGKTYSDPKKTVSVRKCHDQWTGLCIWQCTVWTAANILCMHLVSRLLNTEAFMDTLIQYVGPRVT